MPQKESYRFLDQWRFSLTVRETVFKILQCVYWFMSFQLNLSLSLSCNYLQLVRNNHRSSFRSFFIKKTLDAYEIKMSFKIFKSTKELPLGDESKERIVKKMFFKIFLLAKSFEFFTSIFCHMQHLMSSKWEKHQNWLKVRKSSETINVQTFVVLL